MAYTASKSGFAGKTLYKTADRTGQEEAKETIATQHVQQSNDGDLDLDRLLRRRRPSVCQKCPIESVAEIESIIHELKASSKPSSKIKTRNFFKAYSQREGEQL